ncbi:MAG: hypothetical protein JSS35_18365 [Proteobacteria bacterium]|nr:hypothetical protein [Pseudomonadota bacterium]
MHHHTHLFWLALVIVAALAALLLLRLGFKRQPLSRAQRAKADAGARLPDLADPTTPAPPQPPGDG